MPPKQNYNLDDFDFYLPEEQIAQYPAQERDNSKLFILDREKKQFQHKNFSDVLEILNDKYMLVFNNAKVIPARTYFKRDSGAKIEVVLVRKLSECRWLILTNKTKRLKINENIYCISDENISFHINKRVDEYLEIESSCELTEDVLCKIGEMPLPPYIKRSPEENDMSRYQTVYAEKGNAVAAPTAGLHFTEEILTSLSDAGIESVYLTLDVSWGTFRPVRDQNIEKHKMHSESYHLSEKNAEIINTARSNGKKIIAVGTTSLRVLESTFQNGKNIPMVGETDIFIYPPYKVKSIDGMFTNFHTPKSTLLMLVSAFAGYDLIMKAYSEAVKEKYRFFSYGDSMLIL